MAIRKESSQAREKTPIHLLALVALGSYACFSGHATHPGDALLIAASLLFLYTAAFFLSIFAYSFGKTENATVSCCFYPMGVLVGDLVAVYPEYQQKLKEYFGGR
ncbi:hypothetical protein JKG47_01755 [Acidithiobacillus sp. MC6.1]|nr:hypothetical protein [Acidithiobacillus sp. MC6.1]